MTDKYESMDCRDMCCNFKYEGILFQRDTKHNDRVESLQSPSKGPHNLTFTVSDWASFVINPALQYMADGISERILFECVLVHLHCMLYMYMLIHISLNYVTVLFSPQLLYGFLQ